MKNGDKVKIKTRILGIFSRKDIRQGIIIDIKTVDYEDWFGAAYVMHELKIQMDNGNIVKTIIGESAIPFQKYVIVA